MSAKFLSRGSEVKTYRCCRRWASADHFKGVNDGLGHQAGDRALRQIAAVLSQQVRSSGLVARVGGDEFGILLCEADPESAEAVAERIREAVSRQQLEITDGFLGVHPTLSIGVACFPHDGQDMDGLLMAADKAMYAAKNLGKDRVVVGVSAVEGGKGSG